MQINTIWIPVLARYSKLPQRDVRERLLTQPCYNIAAGLILHTYLEETGGDLMRAIGNYHSHTSFRHEAYQQKVMGSAQRMFGVGR